METNKMKKVLIALDYDPTAKRVAEVGFTLAKAMGAEIVLVHVVVDLVAYSLTYLNMGPLQSESGLAMKDASQLFLEKIKHHLGDMMIKSVIKEGDFADCILETAKEEDIDIIVMGTHSQKWLENIVMGSVAESIMRQSTIPMFIVPTRKRD
jgi:nucleotide-binding universal stress UspA family protein